LIARNPKGRAWKRGLRRRAFSERRATSEPGPPRPVLIARKKKGRAWKLALRRR